MRIVNIVLAGVLLTLPGFATAQKLMSLKPKKPIVCYGKPVDQNTVLNPPKEYQDWKNNPSARTQSALFEVTYTGFTPEAKAAFQKAVDIWSSLITSTQTIRVSAQWQELSAGVLGSASAGSFYANFAGAQQVNTYYPVALAEKMSRKELNKVSDPDIVANFSSVVNWSYDVIGTPQSGKYDLVSVVLHELGHGLGFIDSYSVENENGFVGLQGTDVPMIYDLALENNSGQNLFQTFTSPSVELGAQLTSKQIYYNSPFVLSNNGGVHAKIFAPTAFSGGSSISHLDESTFPSGNSNSLMTPQIGMAEVMHDPGQIVLGAFSDMGWISATIEHDKLLSRENTSGPFTVIAKITSDVDPISDIQLHYNSGSSDTDVVMTATANPKEYTYSIPSTDAVTTYSYYISIKDNLPRTYTNPGKSTSMGKPIEQVYFTFITGPDTIAPVITHSAKEFILNTDTELKIESTITDNLGVELVRLDYLINDVPQPPKNLSWNAEGNLYSFAIPFPVNSLTIGDVIKYRITARDTAVIGNANGNKSYSPSQTEYHIVNVIGLKPAQDSYINDFNSATSDFFGEGFSINTSAGFANPAINSKHPYIEGDGYPDNHLNSVYQLFIPIKIKATDATVKFDEIVLVEPGQQGAEFGSENFFDYVVVEGSIDGGANWTPLADGYDSGNKADWLARFNSSLSGNNSTALGDPTLYKTRVLNLLNKFSVGQEVIIRFRLFSDQLASGWGWAIDNLKIQIDDTPPKVLHNHVDYILSSNTVLPIITKVTDASGLKDISVEYSINNGSVETYSFVVDPAIDEYSHDLQLSGVSPGDEVHYRILATDNANNVGTFPTDGFITAVFYEAGPAVSQYINDFNSPSNDFIGNFFSVVQPAGFTNASINTEHFYQNGIGLDLTSNYSYMLSKPIAVNANNPYIHFDEIAIVEGHISSSIFGNAAFNDYVIVEGSSDGGVTWKMLLDGYDGVSQSTWSAAFSGNKNGTESMFKSRTINIMEKTGFQDGNKVLIRFRLFANETKNGWGWAIDNLSIQGPVTGVEEKLSNLKLRLYPNPANEKITIDFATESTAPIQLNLINTQGQTLSTHWLNSDGNHHSYEMNIRDLPVGLYIIKLESGDKIFTKKFVKD